MIYSLTIVIFIGKDYIIEALHFHLLNSDEQLTIPQTIRTKPRKPVVLPKVSGLLNYFYFLLINFYLTGNCSCWWIYS